MIAKHLEQRDSFSMPKMVKQSIGWWIALQSQQALRI